MSSLSRVPFPKGQNLKLLLDLQFDHCLEDLLFPVLEKPIQDLYSRPKKNIRGQLVDIGCRFLSASNELELSTSNREKIYEILEIIHTGSLIIDDIEDNSAVRRGLPALHNSYGVSIALNAGNWLYFLPFKLIQEMDLPCESKQLLLSEFHHTLLLAHYGQALDVGVSVEKLPQERVFQTALSSIELKSGVLTSFALKAPALARGNEELAKQLSRWGRQTGIALQMFDDIGNFSDGKIAEKKFEDLKLRRLCFVLAVTAQSLSNSEYLEFWKLAENPSFLNEMGSYLEKKGVLETARNRAEAYLSDLIENVDKSGTSQDVVHQFRNLQEFLVGAYE